MSENMPFKIRAGTDGKYFDDEQYTHLDGDVLYVKVADHPVETAIRLLSEQGYDVSIQVSKKAEGEDP